MPDDPPGMHSPRQNSCYSGWLPRERRTFNNLADVDGARGRQGGEAELAARDAHVPVYSTVSERK